MVKAVKGIFIKTEPSIKEVLLKVADPTNIIEDINDESLFMNASNIDEILEKVNKIISAAGKANEN